MATNIKQIIYFHPRLDAAAAAIRSRRSDIDMFRRDFDGPAADTWAEMGRAHGYHACARTEMREPWFPDARLIANAPNLLAVCSLGAGYDVIDVDACTKAGILVCNQSGANKEAVAEHAVGLMLAVSKKIMETDRAMRKESNIERFRYIGTELLGKTIGIIGLGNIGSRVAEICKSAVPHDRARLRPLSLQGADGGAQRREGRAEGDACSAPTMSPCTARGRTKRSA